MSLGNFDAWLEGPIQDLYEEYDRFYNWMEEEGYDPNNTEEVKEAEIAYQRYLEDIAEAYADAAVDAMLDYEYDYVEEMEWAGVEYDEW